MLVSSINPMESSPSVYQRLAPPKLEQEGNWRSATTRPISTHSAVTARTLPSMLACTSAPSLPSSTRPTACPSFTLSPGFTTAAAASSGVLPQLDAHRRWPRRSLPCTASLARTPPPASGGAIATAARAGTPSWGAPRPASAARTSGRPRAAVALAVVAGLLGVQILGAGVQRAQAAGAAQLRPLVPDVRPRSRVKPRLRITLCGCTS